MRTTTTRSKLVACAALASAIAAGLGTPAPAHAGLPLNYNLDGTLNNDPRRCGIYSTTPLNPGPLAGTGVPLLTAAIVVTSVTAVVYVVDCNVHDECLYTTVQNAGGVDAVFGPSPAGAGAVDRISVMCQGDPRPYEAQCRALPSVRNTVTEYSDWWDFSYWTCGDVWDSGSTFPYRGFPNAQALCENVVAQCVENTERACAAPVPPPPVPAPGGALAPVPVGAVGAMVCLGEETDEFEGEPEGDAGAGGGGFEGAGGGGLDDGGGGFQDGGDEGGGTPLDFGP